MLVKKRKKKDGIFFILFFFHFLFFIYMTKELLRGDQCNYVQTTELPVIQTSGSLLYFDKNK